MRRLVNGTAAHAFELDDFHNAKLHPGAVVIPAAFAVAEARGIGGARLETAIAAGYEVMIRTSLALDPSEGRLRGWHLTAICGTFGAAAAAAVLMGLDAERTAWALGLAGTQSGGLFAFNADGTMSKRLHPGRAAQAGIMAAELAELGFSGPTQIYEAEDGGFLWAYSSKSKTGPLVDGPRHQVARGGHDVQALLVLRQPAFLYRQCNCAPTEVEARRARAGRRRRGGRMCNAATRTRRAASSMRR